MELFFVLHYTHKYFYWRAAHFLNKALSCFRTLAQERQGRGWSVVTSRFGVRWRLRMMAEDTK